MLEKIMVFGMGVLLAVGVSLVFALPVYFLWNALMPDIFGLIEITFWQAFGLMVLSGMLFKDDTISSD